MGKEKRKGKSSDQRQTYLRLINSAVYRIGEHIAFEGGSSDDEYVKGLVKKVHKWQDIVKGKPELTPDVIMTEADKQPQEVVIDA